MCEIISSIKPPWGSTTLIPEPEQRSEIIMFRSKVVLPPPLLPSTQKWRMRADSSSSTAASRSFSNVPRKTRMDWQGIKDAVNYRGERRRWEEYLLSHLPVMMHCCTAGGAVHVVPEVQHF